MALRASSDCGRMRFSTRPLAASTTGQSATPRTDSSTRPSGIRVMVLNEFAKPKDSVESLLFRAPAASRTRTSSSTTSQSALSETAAISRGPWM